MDQWNNGNVSRVPYVPRPPENSFSFLYNYNYDHFPVTTSSSQPPMFPTLIDKNQQLNNAMMDHHSYNNIMNDSNYNSNVHHHHDPKKKRLSNEQLESLENSFQEEIKLDPERKQKLAKELGLQPRQIAVWFQNRRARFKVKQLERLYDVLKQEYDAVSKEKQKLQQEVLALRAMLKEQAIMTKKQVSTEVSNDETVESTSIPSDKPRRPMMNTTTTNNIINNNGNNNNNNNSRQIADQSNYAFDVDDYNHVMMAPYNSWAAP